MNEWSSHKTEIDQKLQFGSMVGIWREGEPEILLRSPPGTQTIRWAVPGAPTLPNFQRHWSSSLNGKIKILWQYLKADTCGPCSPSKSLVCAGDCVRTPQLACCVGCLVNPEAVVRSQGAQIPSDCWWGRRWWGHTWPCWRGRQKPACLLADCPGLNGKKVLPWGVSQPLKLGERVGDAVA